MTDWTPGGPPPEQTPLSRPVPVCYRHPERETYIRCARCERPICPDCMIPASVGFQCPECVREGARSMPQPRTTFGGRVSGDAGAVSKALIAITVGFYLLERLSVGQIMQQLWLVGLGQDPALGPGLFGVAAGQWYRLITVAVLHANLLHLLFNMYALWLFGPPLESAFGRLRFGTLYVLSALGGSAASYAFNSPTQPSVGASGAIFGLFAAYIVVGRKLGRDISALLVLLAINVVLGFTIADVDWRAHAGGFLTGGVVALVLVNAPRARRTLVQAAGCIAVALVLLSWVTARTAELTRASAATVVACMASAPVDPGRTFLGCVVAAEAPSGGP